MGFGIATRGAVRENLQNPIGFVFGLKTTGEDLDLELCMCVRRSDTDHLGHSLADWRRKKRLHCLF
jgi:hypothetical protein